MRADCSRRGQAVLTVCAVRPASNARRASCKVGECRQGRQLWAGMAGKATRADKQGHRLTRHALKVKRYGPSASSVAGAEARGRGTCTCQVRRRTGPSASRYDVRCLASSSVLLYDRQRARALCAQSLHACLCGRWLRSPRSRPILGPRANSDVNGTLMEQGLGRAPGPWSLGAGAACFACLCGCWLRSPRSRPLLRPRANSDENGALMEQGWVPWPLEPWGRGCSSCLPLRLLALEPPEPAYTTAAGKSR